MRYILILFLVLSVFPKGVSGAEKETYEFQQLYQTVHQALSAPEDSVLLERVKGDFSLEEKELLLQRQTSDALNKKINETVGMDYNSRVQVWDEISQAYDFESDLFEWEQRLTERLTNLPIYSNEVLKGESGIDLVNSWDDIEESIFGKKFMLSDPTFGKKDSQELSLAIEPWQIGNPEVLKEVPDGLSMKTEMVGSDFAYPTTSNALAGVIFGMVKAFTNLNSQSLSAECTTKDYLELGQTNYKMADLGSMGALNFSFPTKPSLLPEAHTVLETKLFEQFNLLEQMIFVEKSCAEVLMKSDSNVSYSVDEQLNMCESFRKLGFATSLDSILKTAHLEGDKLFGFRISSAYDYIQSHLDSFLEELTLFKEFIEIISKKDKV